MQQMGTLQQQRFREIWYSKPYARFREKMKRLPEELVYPNNCACDECSFDKINTTVYNQLHFYNPVNLYSGQREFTFLQLVPVIFRGGTTSGAKSVRR